VGAFLWLRRRAGGSRRGEFVGFAAVVATVFGWLMWMARPSFLPLGSGPDLTHHVLLIEFIERRWTLVHEASVESFLGEMVHYTPGSHILAALTGALLGSNGLHVVHGLVAATVALKVGFVFLIALRVLPSDVSRVPLALASVVLLLAPRAYVLGSFTHDSFFAQVVAECFVVSLWWMLTVWDQSPSFGLMALFPLVSAATFLTWPVFVGAPIVACAALMALRREMPVPERTRQFAIAVLPAAIVAALYIFGRAGWMQIVRTGGSVLKPAVQEYGWWFLALSATGMAVASFERSARATVLFVGAIGLEMLGLFIAARTRANETPYMALKMFYLLIYPQAVAATIALAVAVRVAARALGTAFGPPAVRLAATASALALSVFAARPFAAPVLARPAVSEPLVLAGAWANDHVPQACVDYLVSDSFTGYWLHLAVLGNPRMSARTGNPATFDRTAAIVRWLSPGGYPYAIADLSTLPADVRSDLDVVADFGTAAVVKRRGPSSCKN
jgi:hypothetical protein